MGSCPHRTLHCPASLFYRWFLGTWKLGGLSDHRRRLNKDGIRYLTDTFPRNCSVGGGGHIGEFGRGGAGPKKISKFEISRGWHFCKPLA